MLRHLSTHRVLWLIVTLLALGNAVAGLLWPEMYTPVVPARVLPGTLSQDLVTVALAAVVLALSLSRLAGSVAGQSVILATIAYLYYGYGIYVIEQIYTPLYLIYMAVFGLSFYTLAYAVACLRTDLLPRISLPKGVRWGGAALALWVALMFYVLWVSQIVPLIREGHKLDALFSVYILDLCFIMPAYALSAVSLARRRAHGLLLMPALYVMGALVTAPLSLGELLKPRYGLIPNMADVGLYGGLTAVFLAATVVYLLTLRFRPEG